MKNANHDRRTVKTLRALENALIYLLEKESFEDITIKELTSQANVNRITFYSHFNSKEELINFTFDDIYNKTKRNIKLSLNELSNKDVNNVLKISITKAIESIYTYRNMIKSLINEKSFPFIEKLLNNIRDISLKFLHTYFKDINVKTSIKSINDYLIGGICSLIYFNIKNDIIISKERMISNTLNLTNTILTNNIQN